MYFDFAAPEKVGINSNHIKKYVDYLEKNKVCLHSFLLIKDSKIIAEGYEKHFDSEYKHRLYSVSKTYTSAAVGCLIDEGRLSLDDKVYKFFPDKCPENLHEYVKIATVRDLLIMSTPFDCTTYKPTDKDWVYTFFNTEPSHRPGRVFNYDTSATLVLCALIERVSGKDFSEYLYEKVLKEIGYKKAPECVREPGGVQWGGSGIFASSRELAAFAHIFINNGKSLDGKQLISEEYVKAATSFQICNTQTTEWAPFRAQGYGYQIWIWEDGFTFLGMGNQLAICVPEKNIILVTTADDQGNAFARESIFTGLQNFIIQNCGDCNIGDYNDKGAVNLDNMLSLALPDCNNLNEIDFKANGVTYKIAENNFDFETVKFDINQTNGKMTYYRKGEKKELIFGIGHFEDGFFPEIYSGMTINEPNEGFYKCAAAGMWAEKDKLVIRVYIIDRYFGNMTMNVSFKENKLDISMRATAEWFLTEYRGYLTSKDE